MEPEEAVGPGSLGVYKIGEHGCGAWRRHWSAALGHRFLTVD